jgi:hypothetical protein
MLSILCLFMYGLNGQSITHSHQIPNPTVTEIDVILPVPVLPDATQVPVVPDVPVVVPVVSNVPVLPDVHIVPVVSDVPVVTNVHVVPNGPVVPELTSPSPFMPQMSNLPSAPRFQEFQTSITPSPTILPTQQLGTSGVTVSPLLIIVSAAFVASCVIVVLLFACNKPKKRLQDSFKITDKNVDRYL